MLSSEVRLSGHHGEIDVPPAVRHKSLLYRSLRAVAAGFSRARVFIGGFLIGLSAWTPVFFATAADEASWQQYGLPGGLALFGAGVWLRTGRFAFRENQTNSRGPAGPSRPGRNRLPA